MLFTRPHPDVPLSMFMFVQMLSAVAFVDALNDVRKLKTQYDQAKYFSSGDTAHIKLLGAQRNTWISGTGCGLWLILHRFRTLKKQLLDLEIRGELDV